MLFNKSFFYALLAFTCCAVADVRIAHADFLIQPNDTLAICGDSITEQRRYSVFLEDYLLMCQPTDGLKIAQFGWSGERAPGLLARLDTDVFPFKPTIATTCYGMNDGGYGPLSETTANTYRTNQTAIVEAMKKAGVRTIVLGSPKCVDTFTYHNDPAAAEVYNKTLASLGQIDQDIAAKEGVVYADVFGATLSAMEKSKAELGKEYVFGGPDGVHPGLNGHLVMAYAFLKALGCDGNIGTITVDLTGNHAEGSPGQKVLACQDGVVKLESTRYPFCFPNDPAPDNAATILKYVPFNDDLNRYELVVTGLKTAKAKVTWGKTSKHFSADDLAKGINLAAEFLDNPFVDQFTKINAAVKSQQFYETNLVKGYLHNLKQIQEIAPSESASIDRITTTGMAKNDKFYQAATTLVTPVQHTLTITPEVAP